METRKFPIDRHDRFNLIARWVAGKPFPTGFAIGELISDALKVPPNEVSMTDRIIVGTILGCLGFERHQVRIENRRQWRYFRRVALEVVTVSNDNADETTEVEGVNR
jgi:hypothetical protein